MRPYVIDLDVPSAQSAVGASVTVYHLTRKVVHVHTVAPNAEYQVQISTDGSRFENYGASFNGTGFLEVNLHCQLVRVVNVAPGAGGATISGVQE